MRPITPYVVDLEVRVHHGSPLGTSGLVLLIGRGTARFDFVNSLAISRMYVGRMDVSAPNSYIV